MLYKYILGNKMENRKRIKSKKSKQEMERLMQMVKVSQEEQMAKDKLIKELQEWVIRKMFSIQCR